MEKDNLRLVAKSTENDEYGAKSKRWEEKCDFGIESAN